MLTSVLSRRSLPSVVPLAIALGTTGSAGAHERAAPIDVQWSGPPTCAPELFEADLAALLADSEMSAPLRVEVTVARTPIGWVLQADFSSGGDSRGQRVFAAEACETVQEAAALAIALTIDPAVASGSPPSASSPEENPAVPAPVETFEPEEAVAPEPAEAAPLPRHPSRPLEVAVPEGGQMGPPWRAGLAALGFVDGFALPGVGGGLSLVGSAMRGPLRLELQGSYRFATDLPSSLDPSVGGSFTQWTAGLRALWVPRWSRLEVPMGGGIDAGQTIAEGTGFEDALRTRQPWLAVVATAGVSFVVLPRLALLARASLAVPLNRPNFAIEGLEPVHQIGPVQARGLLGVEVRLP